MRLLARQVTFVEVKRQERNVDLTVLRSKADVMMRATHRFSDYEKRFIGLTIEDM